MRESDSNRHEDVPAEEKRPSGEKSPSDTSEPVRDDPAQRDADSGDRGTRPRSESADPDHDSHSPERDRRAGDDSTPEDGFVVAPIPLGDGPEGRSHGGERRAPGERPIGGETPAAAKARPEPADGGESRRGAPPERTDGHKPHPGTLDDPSNTRVREEDSTEPAPRDPDTVRERYRGRCGELALRLLRQITGNESIHPPQRRVGPEGMRLEELVAGAGGKLEDFPKGHEGIANRLRKLGDGASALVVDRYAGPVDEHGVGAHAYLLVNEGGDIVVKDPAAGLDHGFPPRVPNETQGVHAILFDSDGKAVHPLKDSVRAGLLHLADVHVGETHPPRDSDDTSPDEATPRSARPENTGEDARRPQDFREDVERPRRRRDADPERRVDDSRPDADHGSDAGHPGDEAAPDWSHRPQDDWSTLDRERIAEKLHEDWDLDVTGFDNTHVDVEVLREFARAIEDMFNRFPDTELMEVRIGPIDDDSVFAEVDPGRDGNVHFADILTLNEHFARKPDELARRVRLNEENGHLVPGSGDRPVYSTIVHEFAHAIDFTSQMKARVDAFEALERHFDRVYGGDAEEFLGWLHDELSGYSFDENGMYDHAEALAEAFTDVVLNGDLASEPAQILHDHLDRIYRDHAADNPVYEREAPERRSRPVDEDPGPAARRDREPEPKHPDRRSEPSPHASPRDDEGAGREKSSREPEFVLQPPEPIETPAVVDHWTALDRQGVRDRINIDLGIETAGFHVIGDVEALRELGRALEEGIADNPGIKPRRVEVGPIPGDTEVLASAFGVRQTDGSGPWRPDRIVFNDRWALDPAGFEQGIRESVAAGFHVPGSDERPIFAVIVHEYGHLLDYYGQMQAREGLTRDLADRYVETNAGADFAEFSNWLHRELPGYAFDKHGMLDEGEALAEAYRDVKLNGDNASDLSKMMVDRLRAAARDAAGLHAQDPAAPREHGSGESRQDQLGSHEESGVSPEEPATQRDPADPEGSVPPEDATDPAPAHPPADWSPRPDDFWSELDRDGIIREMKDLFGITRFEGLDNTSVDPEVLREFARALDDVTGQNKITLRGVEIGEPVFEDSLAEATSVRDADGNLVTEKIVVRLEHALNPAEMAEIVRNGEAAGSFPRGAGERPMYSVFLHELGHAIDHAGNRASHAELANALLDHYLRTHGDTTPVEYLGWLSQLSDYSFNADGSINHSEALAEAFVDVTLNFDHATEPAKVLHRLLTDRAAENAHLVRDLAQSAEPVTPAGDEQHGTPPADPRPEAIRGDDRPNAAHPDDRPEDAHADDGKPAPEPDLVPPPEPTEVPAIADHWSTLDHQDVINRIENELGIPTVGLHLASDVETVREYGRALEDMMAQHPGVKPKSVEIGPIPEDSDAIAGVYPSREDGRLVPGRMVFNERWATDATGLDARIHDKVEQGKHVAGSDARPVYSAIVHEFGHVLDYAGERAARHELTDILAAHFEATRSGSLDVDAFTEWLHQLPEYAFDEKGALHHGEALAEAFRDVTLNGRDAAEPSQVMYQMLRIAAQDTGVLQPHGLPEHQSTPTEHSSAPAERQSAPAEREPAIADSDRRPNTDGRPDLLGDRDSSGDSSESNDPNRPERSDQNQPDPRESNEPPTGAEEPAQPVDPGAERPAPESRTAAGEPAVGDARWFDQRMAEHADFAADMEAKHARFLHEMADSAPPGSTEERLFREQAREVDDMARSSAERADRLWADLGGRPAPAPATRPVREESPTPETAAAGDGQPPNDGPPRRSAATPDDPDAWFNEQRAIQADWVAHMDAKRARWFHDMADQLEPGSQAEREARFEARMADAEARLSALRAEYMWDFAGGRPEPTPGEAAAKQPASSSSSDPSRPTPPGPSAPVPPSTSAPRSGDGARSDGAGPRSKPLGTNPNETPTVEVKRPEQSNPDETPTVEVKRPDQSNPDETPTVELKRPEQSNPDETPTVEVKRPDQSNPDETPTVELKRPEQSNPDETPTVEIPRQEAESPKPPADPAEASPGLQAALDRLRAADAEAGERPRSLEDQVYGARLTDALGVVEALAKRPDALSALRHLAETAAAEGFFHDPANGLNTRPHAPEGGEPRTLTLEELRTELLHRLGLPESTPDDLLPRIVGDEQLRNLLRAGGIEALREAVFRHDNATGPERERAARTRDGWADLLGVDKSLLDPARTTPEQRRAVLDELRGETLRHAGDVADLMVAGFHHPASDHTHVVLEADGERVHIRVTEDTDGNKRAEVIQRPDLPRETPAETKEPEKKPGWLKRVWRRMMHGYHGQSPKYPSGSGNDSKGQTMLAMEIGYVTHDEALLHLKDKFNPARILKETATLWKERERLPLVKHLTARVADVAGDLLPMRTRDGGEYRPWVTEADPRIRAEVEETLRSANMPIESEMPEPQHEPLDRGPVLDPPAPREWSSDLPQPLVDAVTTRDAALGDLVRLARGLGIDIPDDSPETLRRVVNEAVYKLMRRAGAIEALRDVSERWLMEDAQIPFSREVSIFDKDPLGRYLREFAHAEALRTEEEKAARRREEAGVGPDDDSLEFRPRRPRPSFLDLQGVNNGGEWPRHFDDADEELSSRREGRLFEDALRRDQIQDERSNWAQLLDIGLDRLGTEADLRRAIAEARMDARDEARGIAELDAAVQHFLDLDSDARRHAADLAEAAAHDWVNEHGGVMLDPERGLAVLPGEPRRLVVIRGEADHDVRLVDSLSAHPEIREQLNRGELRLDYRVVGLDGNDRVHVIEVDPPQIRFHDVEVDGERTPVALLRNGLEPWRIVQPTPEARAPHAEPATKPAAPRDPAVVRAERNAVAARLSVYDMDLGANLDRTIADLHHDNALRAAQIEGMADFIRSSDAIDNFHDLDRTLQQLAHRLDLDPDTLSPEKLAAAMADPNVRKVRRLQAVDDLIKYAKVLRDNIDEKAVLAARKELASRLDVEPDDLSPRKPKTKDGEVIGFTTDSKNTDKHALLDAIHNLLRDSADRPELLAALLEYSSVLGDLDPFRHNLRYDPLTDPRAVDGELPIHDGDAPAALRAFMNDSIGEPPLSDNPSAAATVWSRLLGVHMNDFARTVKIYTEQLGGLHDRVTPKQFADVLTTLRETGDSTVAYERYRDSAADPTKILTKDQLTDLVRRVRNARYAEVYEAYRDGKIEKHERLSAKELAATIDELRADVRAREADIKLLEKLAAEHDALTKPRPPEGPPRDPRAVATDLAAARHELRIAAEGRDYAQGRAYRENSGPGFRPLREGDLTPERMPGTNDYLAHRPSEEGGSLPGLEQRLTDLTAAVEEHDGARSRVDALESEMRRAVEAGVGPDESPVDAWRREVDTARAELEELIAADPALARQGLDRTLADIERLSRMPQQWGDVFTDELVPLRDAAHRYEQAREFLAAAESDAAAAARAAETPEQTAARELASARDDLANAAPADRQAAQDRVSRWEAEHRLLEARAAHAADTPHQAADRPRTAAHDDLTRAIADFRRTTGLDVTEAELAPEHLRDTVNRLLPRARGTVPEVVGAFERLENAARALHRADALTEWVDAHFPESGHTGREGEDPGAPGAPTRPQGPTQPNSDPSSAARNPEGDGQDGGSHAVTRNDSGETDVNRSFARRVEEAIAAGEAEVVVLSTGMGRMAERVELVTFATDPPTQLVRKIVTNPQHAHAEALVSLVGQAVGANVPQVHRVQDRVVYMEVMPGEVGADRFTTPMAEGLDAALATPDGRRLGLLDVLVGIPDRNLVNWLITADGQISGIDHSLAFGGGRRGDELSTSLFARHYATEGADGEITWHDHDLSAGDMPGMRTRLEGLAPEFAALGRDDWHRALMDRFDEVERHARASDEGRTGDEGDPGPTPARPSNPKPPGSSPTAATPPVGATPPGSGGGGKEPPNRNSSTPPNPDPDEPGNSGRNGDQNSTPPSKPGDGQTAKLPEGSEDPTVNLSSGGEDSTKKLPEGSEDPTVNNPPPGEASTSKMFEGNDDPTVNMSRENASNEQTFEGNDDPTVKNPPPGEASSSKPFEGNEDPTVQMERGSEAKPPGSEDPTVELPKPPGSEDPTVELTRPSETATLELPRVQEEVLPVDPVADSPSLQAAARFLRDAVNDPLAPGREVNAVLFTSRLMDALGLDTAAAHLNDPLAHFREIAEMAKARGFFGDPDDAAPPLPMREADDYRPLTPEELYGSEEYWRTEADPETLRAIEAHLRETGLDRRLAELGAEEPTRALDPAATRRELPSSAAHPEGGGEPVRERPLETWSQRPHDPEGAESRVFTLEELRNRLAGEFGLSEEHLQRRNLPELAGDLQFRNLLRIGGLEALDHVLSSHDAATGAEREHLARVRDEWARLLGIPESALDPAHTTVEQRDAVLAAARSETLRRAMDVADLMVAALHVPDSEHAHVVLETDGERLHARIVESPDGAKRVELVPRPELGPLRPAAKPSPSWIDNLLQRLQQGYHGQSPKYPSGSRLDSSGISLLTLEFGYNVLHDHDFLGMKPNFNPVRIGKEILTLWEGREHLPFVRRLTRRVADISPPQIPMRTADGGEYRPHVTEADPVLRAEVEESLRLAEMTIESELPELRHEPVDPVTAEPEPHEWGTDVPQPLVDAADARDAALVDFVHMARELRIPLADADPRTVRAAVGEARYRLMRRGGAIEALRDAGQRWLLENEVIPFSREISIFDKDPLGRFLREFAHARGIELEELKARVRREEAGVGHDDPPLELRAREPRPSLLDVEGVNNGGEWVPHFDDVDQELVETREGALFKHALRRDQMQDERSNWAQLLDIGLDRIETQADLDHLVSDLRMDIRDGRARMLEFAALADRFLGADDQLRERVHEVSDLAAREWADANGGVMLDRDHGVALLPGENGGPERLVVIRGDGEHDIHLVDALAAHPDVRRMLNHGELQLEYRNIGLDEHGNVHLVGEAAPTVRFHDVDVDGHPRPVAVMREDGRGLRLVEPTPEPVATPHEASNEPAVPRDPDTLRNERNAVARRLSLEVDFDLGENLGRTIESLRQELSLRASQLEGMADFIRTSDAIDTFNDLDGALGNLANRLGLDPEQLSPRAVAEAFGDPRFRMGERRHQAFADLLEYADVLRKNGHETAVLAARDRLVRLLDADRENLHASKAVKDAEKVEIVGFEPDTKTTVADTIARAFENMAFRPDERRAHAIDALTDYIEAIAALDPHRDGLRYDPSTDPRAVDGELPVHDPKGRELLSSLYGDFVGEPPLASELIQAGEVWSRLLGVDTSNIDKTVKIYESRLGSLHDRMSPAQLREVLRTLTDTTGNRDAAYQVYRDSVTDTRKLLSSDQVSEIVRVVRKARDIEVYEAYRDGKIEKHERLSPKEFSAAVDAMRGEIQARKADIDLLERLATEHHNLTNPPEPEAPPRDPRTVGPELAAARHELQIAEEGLDYAKGRMWREREGEEFRPLGNSDLTPDNLPGTQDYLANRNRAEGGELPGNEQRIDDLSTAAAEFDRAQNRVQDLETELRRGMAAAAEPGETPADVWQREAESARADLEALVDTDPAAPHGIDHAIDQIERLSRMPLAWGDVWTDELVPLRDAVHRYQRAEEFLAAARTAEADAAAAAARAAETPEQTAARELATARDELAAAEAQGDTARRDAAADRAARWEAEQRRIADAAAADADTPQTAAHRAREEAHTELRAAIENFQRATGLDVTEAALAPDRLRATITDLLGRAHGNLPDVVRAFDRLQSAAEALHAADTVAHWVDNHYPDPVRAIDPGEGEPGGGPKRLGPGTPPTDPTGGAPARPGPTKPGTDPATTAKQPESGAQPVTPITHSSTTTTHSGSEESTGTHKNGSDQTGEQTHTAPEQNAAPEQASAPTGSNWVVVEPGTVHTWSDPALAAWADGAMAQARAATERHDLMMDDLHAIALELGVNPDGHELRALKNLLMSRVEEEGQRQQQLGLTPEGTPAAEGIARKNATDQRARELYEYGKRIARATSKDEQEAHAFHRAVQEAAAKDILTTLGAEMWGTGVGIVHGKNDIAVVVSPNPDPLAFLGRERQEVLARDNILLVAKLLTLDLDGTIHVHDLDLPNPPPAPESTPHSGPPAKPPASPGSPGQPGGPGHPGTPGQPGVPVTHGASGQSVAPVHASVVGQSGGAVEPTSAGGKGDAAHSSQPTASTSPTPEPPTAVVVTEVTTPQADLHGAILFEGNLPDGPDATPLYRGVPRLLPDGSVNPAYLDGLRGIVPARGDLDLDYDGHTSHLGSQSDATSWSRSQSVAAHFAGTDGLIMEWRTGAPPEGATWRFKPTYDLDDLFSQVLIQGTLTDARAIRHLPSAPTPETPPTPPTPEPPTRPTPPPSAVTTASPSLGIDPPTPAKPHADNASQLPPVESPQGSDNPGAPGDSTSAETIQPAGAGEPGSTDGTAKPQDDNVSPLPDPQKSEASGDTSPPAKPTPPTGDDSGGSESQGAPGDPAKPASGDSDGSDNSGAAGDPLHVGAGDSDGSGASGDPVQPDQGDSGGATDGSEPAGAGEPDGSGGTGEHVGSGRSDADDPDESGSGSTSEPDAGDSDRSDGDASTNDDTPFRYSPNWRSHLPLVPHQFDPEFSDYTPKPPEQPAPWTLPPDPNPPHTPPQPHQPTPHQPTPQPHQPQPTPHQPTPQPHQPTTPQMPVPPNAPQPPHIPQPPNLPQPPHIPGAPQQPTSPQWPQLPPNPGAPQWPTNPGMPQVPTNPGMPQVPVNPGWPQLPHQPGGQPADPGLPHPPQWPTDPNLPQQPSHPGVPQQPTHPGAPQQPQWPTDPGLPQQPSRPGVPNWPTNPGLPQVPADPGWQHQPGVPQTPSNPGGSHLPQWLTDAMGSRMPVQPEVPQQGHPHTDPGMPRWVADSSDGGNSGVNGGGHAGANGANGGNGGNGIGGAGQGFPGGAPMMPPQGAPGGGNGNGSRGNSRFPRASGRPASGGQIYLRSHSGFGEYALMDPMTGQLSAAPVGTAAPAGVFDELDGLRVVFYRDPAAGLVLRVGDQVIELDRMAAGALWERSGQGFVRLVIGSPGDVRCELRYSERPADADLGLLIRDVLSDSSRRLGIFG
ncbi:hypothetical protein ACFV4K_01400 [Nocardia sp. NPDC059764]|uniref:hypothetical protein n=1 Tax=Nocardia sp. NPDC059764 TaxID=3346939 RepID=UPI00365E4184